MPTSATRWRYMVAMLAVLALGAAEGPGMTTPRTPEPESDRAALLAHIDSIFRAYVRRDRAKIRATHTENWVGFQGPSTKIERGIDDYMVNAEVSLRHLEGTGYEILDSEIQLFGDLALVYYVARYEFLDDTGQPGSLGLRALDVYRRIDGDWIQIGSHIGPLPRGGAWGEGEQADEDAHD